MKLCIDCEKCRIATSLYRCKTAREVVSRGDFYLWYHTDRASPPGIVPMLHVESDEWNSPLCWHHRERPDDVTKRVFSQGPRSVGIYPDRDTFFLVGEPLIKDAVRTALVRFEDDSLPPQPVKRRAPRLPTISESWAT
jgi:hypothetical protein